MLCWGSSPSCTRKAKRQMKPNLMDLLAMFVTTFCCGSPHVMAPKWSTPEQTAFKLPLCCLHLREPRWQQTMGLLGCTTGHSSTQQLNEARRTELEERLSHSKWRDQHNKQTALCCRRAQCSAVLQCKGVGCGWGRTSGSAIALACRSLTSSSEAWPVMNRWICAWHRRMPSCSSELSGAYVSPFSYVSSAFSYSFIRNFTFALREYPFTNSGFSSMHLSASFSPACRWEHQRCACMMQTVSPPRDLGSIARSQGALCAGHDSEPASLLRQPRQTTSMLGQRAPT